MYGIFTLYDRLFQGVPLAILLPRRGPTTPISPGRNGFGLFRVRSPLLTESLFIFSSYGYLDVSVPHVRLPFGMTGLQPAGLPHSEIPGSRDICSSPGLVAAYHVLRRLREPRHPPSALAYFLSPRALSAGRYILSSLYSFSSLLMSKMSKIFISRTRPLSGQGLAEAYPLDNLWRITDSNR